MTDKIWEEIDTYFESRLCAADSVLTASLKANADAGLPPYDVTPLQGQFLQLLARIHGPRRILEVGTLGGYSSICLVRGMQSIGKLVTLEVDPHHAAVAKENFERAGVRSQIEIIVGDAANSIAHLHATAADPFDFIFIDADKQNNPTYFEWAMKLGRAGSVIVIDNVVRDGCIIDRNSEDPCVAGVRKVIELIQEDENFFATAIQTVGRKGHDGFTIGVIR